MSIQELTEEHRAAALALMQDKSLAGRSGERADQLVVAIRHILCCWILNEATEAELAGLATLPDTENVLGPV